MGERGRGGVSGCQIPHFRICVDKFRFWLTTRHLTVEISLPKFLIPLSFLFSLPSVHHLFFLHRHWRRTACQHLPPQRWPENPMRSRSPLRHLHLLLLPYRPSEVRPRPRSLTQPLALSRKSMSVSIRAAIKFTSTRLGAPDTSKSSTRLRRHAHTESTSPTVLYRQPRRLKTEG